VTTLRFHLHAAAVLAPGLPSLADLRAVSRGEHAYEHRPCVVPAAAMLPAQERRRASKASRLVLACIDQAVQGSRLQGDTLHTVFATDEGTGEICQQMLEALATSRQVSPLLFSNSVVNAPSGYFSIAWRNRQSCTVVSLGLESFASGLLCAVTEAQVHQRTVVLIAYDPPMTAPLDELLPVREEMACAWVIGCTPPAQDLPALASFALTLAPGEPSMPAAFPDWMPAAWASYSSARGLAALALLDAAEDAELQLALGAQCVRLRRTAKGAP
jgi:hypothetical protein